MVTRQTILILVLAALAAGQDIAAKANELVSAYAKQGKFSGAVLIAKNGKIDFEKAYGKLKVGDQACDYLPACPEIWKPITIHTRIPAI